METDYALEVIKQDIIRIVEEEIKDISKFNINNIKNKINSLTKTGIPSVVATWKDKYIENELLKESGVDNYITKVEKLDQIDIVFMFDSKPHTIKMIV